MGVRAFFAVEVPTTEAIRGLLGSLRATGERLKVVTSENLHLTLKFLGEVPEAQVEGLAAALEAACRGHGPISVTVAGTGAFPQWSSPRVLWLGVEEGGGLVALANVLEERCLPLGFPPEGRPFSPHLTIARVKEGNPRSAVAKLRDHQGDTFASFVVDKVKLKKSTLRPGGPLYEDLTAVDLTHGLG